MSINVIVILAEFSAAAAASRITLGARACLSHERAFATGGRGWMRRGGMRWRGRTGAGAGRRLRSDYFEQFGCCWTARWAYGILFPHLWSGMRYASLGAGDTSGCGGLVDWITTNQKIWPRIGVNKRLV